MNYRAKNIGIAVALAALAAILTSAYVVNYKRHVQNGEGKVTVLVAARDIPAGTSGADVVDQKMLKEQTVPRKAVVAGAISSPDQLSQYVAAQDVFEGEQVSTRRFTPPTEQGVRWRGLLPPAAAADEFAGQQERVPGRAHDAPRRTRKEAVMTTATETTTRVRVYATGSCEGFDKLRDSLGSHPEIELVGASN